MGVIVGQAEVVSHLVSDGGGEANRTVVVILEGSAEHVKRQNISRTIDAS